MDEERIFIIPSGTEIKKAWRNIRDKSIPLHRRLTFTGGTDAARIKYKAAGEDTSPEEYHAYALEMDREKIGKAIADLFTDAVPPATADGSSAKMLDIAAGTGIISGELAKAGYTVTALDTNAEYLAFLKQQLPQIETVTGDMNERLPFADNTFDGVTSTFANRYITDADAYLKEIQRVMKPGAVCIWPIFRHEAGIWKKKSGGKFPTKLDKLTDVARRTGFAHITNGGKVYKVDRSFDFIAMQK